MSLSFKFIPLTFLSDENEIKKQIRNTIILKYFFARYRTVNNFTKNAGHIILLFERFSFSSIPEVPSLFASSFKISSTLKFLCAINTKV